MLFGGNVTGSANGVPSGGNDVPAYDSMEQTYGQVGQVGGRHHKGHKTRRGKSRRAKTRRGGGVADNAGLLGGAEHEMKKHGGGENYAKKHGGKRRKGSKSTRRKSSRRR